jgi:ribosome biogenesis protein NSA2
MAMHEEKKTKKKEEKPVPDGAIPAYLMDREGQSQAKALSNMIKQKRKEKAGKWTVPLPKVCCCPLRKKRKKERKKEK